MEENAKFQLKVSENEKVVVSILVYRSPEFCSVALG